MESRRRFGHRRVVVEGDIDSLGHVNNTVYLRYIEDCVTAHAESVGMGLPRLRQLGVIPVVHRHTITYHRSALLGDELEVSTEIVAFRSFRATRHNRIERAGVLLVECQTEWVWVDPLRGRPKAVPKEIQAAFGLI
ncbi:thioesterase family protein [Meiothermus sp. CFH 77666]|uniref:acyl-CoA thioesterase n=1 Tax=Meiothermus sp. CFH 77666 TaxID=2817942 RepID=UPI001AA063E8|nr:thioesterase family protein [Meiothermus sp. CFH 77666]MBO1436346.1 acyl-CoA thioesterase [Meiothermus sp. CFH 77666]